MAFAAMMGLSSRREVLHPIPGFPIYHRSPRGLGETAVPFGWKRKTSSSRTWRKYRKGHAGTSAIIFNSPNNPTGTVFSQALWSILAALAASTSGDDFEQVYARILCSGIPVHLVASRMAERT